MRSVIAMVTMVTTIITITTMITTMITITAMTTTTMGTAVIMAIATITIVPIPTIPTVRASAIRSGSELMARDYIKDPAEIYRQSFATIEAEADLARLPTPLHNVARRMIHACGMTDLVDDIAWDGDPVTTARESLKSKTPIFCDAQMVASGIIRDRVSGNEIVCA